MVTIRVLDAATSVCTCPSSRVHVLLPAVIYSFMIYFVLRNVLNRMDKRKFSSNKKHKKKQKFDVIKQHGHSNFKIG
jgi:hypothetical protein